MKTDNNDEQLIKQLKQLPKINDHRDKDELFQRISTQINVKISRKNYKLVPIFSTLIAVMLIVAIIPVLVNLSMSETRLNDSAGSISEESNLRMEKSVEQGDEDQEIQIFDTHIESYVLQNIDDHSTIIYGAVSDDQLQTVIPLTIVIPGSEDLNIYYNKLNQYLAETDWGVNQYLFNDVNFDLDLANHEVRMQIPDNFSLGDGSSNAHIFNEVLAAMFIPYQIDKVVFDEDIDLGAIGNVSELPLQKFKKRNYKYFQADTHQRKFLVPIKIEDNITIKDAFEDMKSGQKSFNIYPSIPENIQFTLTESDRELIITFDQDQIFEDEQRAIMMIEAILMTAKSFGYELVTFNDFSINQVGPYQLSESITVPEAINPIY